MLNSYTFIPFWQCLYDRTTKTFFFQSTSHAWKAYNSYTIIFGRAILQTFNGKNFKWTRLLSLKDATTDAANDYYYDEDVWQKLQKRTQPRDIYDLQATTGRHDGLVNHVASGAPPVSLLHKVLYSKYSKQWSHFMAFTMDCDCSEISIMV